MRSNHNKVSFIRIENFKSYKGEHVIGPLKNFMCIIGPNGSGKSNLMDAVSFVLGESTRNLRVKSLSDLVHSSYSKKRAKVSITIENGESIMTFTRAILDTVSEYRINSQIVSANEYIKNLEEIGINVKARNFLVFQGQVESIAMKSGKERTAIFEQLCGSAVYKNEYNKSKSEHEKCEREMQIALARKRTIDKERKEVLAAHSGGEQYNKLVDNLNQAETQLALYELYNNKQILDSSCNNAIKKFNEEMKTINKTISDNEEKIRIEKIRQKDLRSERIQLQKNQAELKSTLSDETGKAIEIKQELTYLDSKLDSLNRTFIRAKNISSKSKEHIETYKKAIEDLKVAQKSFEESIVQQSQTQKSHTTINESLHKEYLSLKNQSDLQCNEFNQKLDKLKDEKRRRKNELDGVKCKEKDLLNLIEKNERELDEIRQKMIRSEEFKSKHIDQLNERREDLKKMQLEFNQTNINRQQVQNKLNDINKEIHESNIISKENKRINIRREVINQLKSITGVYGRLVDHCQPVHRRYQIALAKVLAKNIDAIIVNNQRTARTCIQYLKDRGFYPETFLPLDSLKVSSIDSVLSKVNEKTKLLIDVVKYNPSEIKLAIQYAVGNTLVAEDDDIARDIAYGSNVKYKVVSLQGTLFNKSGVVSGGSLDLARAAARFDQNKLEALCEQSINLREQMKILDDFDETSIFRLKSEISSIQNRIGIAEGDLERLKCEQSKLIDSTDELKKKLVEIKPKSDAAMSSLSKTENEINNIELEIQHVEDSIFQDFCREISVDNIRVYENRELADYQKQEHKRKDFEVQLKKLYNLLDFERSRTCEDPSAALESQITEMQNKIKESKKNQISIQKLCADIKIKLNNCDKELSQKKSQFLISENTLTDISRSVKSENEKKNSLSNQINQLSIQADKLKLHRHELLMNVKINDIYIPLLSGSFDMIGNHDLQPSEQSQQFGSELLQKMFSIEDKLEIDFTDLPNNLHRIVPTPRFLENVDKLTSLKNELKGKLQTLQTAMMRTSARLTEVQESLEQANKELEEIRKRSRHAYTQFERIKLKRLDSFMKCFEYVSNQIDQIYKNITQDQRSQAYLCAEKPDEPYLDGITFSCIVPGKRFRVMDDLSGGEKTMAAIALLFAIRSYSPTPFFMMDEVDAALDEQNVANLSRYLHQQSKKNMQLLIISLKDDFYDHCEGLIGICSDQRDNCVQTRTLMLDLTIYPEEIEEIDEEDTENIMPPW